MLMVSGPEKDEERKQSMILNKNTIESWNHSPLIGFRDQGRRCGGLQSQTTCVGLFFSWIGLVVLPKIAGSAAINSFNV